MSEHNITPDSIAPEDPRTGENTGATSDNLDEVWGDDWLSDGDSSEPSSGSVSPESRRSGESIANEFLARFPSQDAEKDSRHQAENNLIAGVKSLNTDDFDAISNFIGNTPNEARLHLNSYQRDPSVSAIRHAVAREDDERYGSILASASQKIIHAERTQDINTIQGLITRYSREINDETDESKKNEAMINYNRAYDALDYLKVFSPDSVSRANTPPESESSSPESDDPDVISGAASSPSTTPDSEPDSPEPDSDPGDDEDEQRSLVEKFLHSARGMRNEVMDSIGIKINPETGRYYTVTGLIGRAVTKAYVSFQIARQPLQEAILRKLPEENRNVLENSQATRMLGRLVLAGTVVGLSQLGMNFFGDESSASNVAVDTNPSPEPSVDTDVNKPDVETPEPSPSGPEGNEEPETPEPGPDVDNNPDEDRVIAEINQGEGVSHVAVDLGYDWSDPNIQEAFTSDDMQRVFNQHGIDTYQMGDTFGLAETGDITEGMKQDMQEVVNDLSADGGEGAGAGEQDEGPNAEEVQTAAQHGFSEEDLQSGTKISVQSGDSISSIAKDHNFSSEQRQMFADFITSSDANQGAWYEFTNTNGATEIRLYEGAKITLTAEQIQALVNAR